MDCIVHRVTKSQTQLRDLHTHTQVHGRGAGEALQTISGFYFKRTRLGFTEASRLPGGPVVKHLPPKQGTRIQSLV